MEKPATSKPTWVSIIGVLLIVFGAFGIFGGAQEIMMPTIMEMQKGVLDSIGKSIESGMHETSGDQQGNSGQQKAQQEQMAKLFTGMMEQFQPPEWYKSWAAVFGLISIVVSVLYLVSGIFLLMIKRFAIPVFYVAIGASITWAIIQGVIFSQSPSGMLLSKIPGSIASIVIDIILVVVVIAADKEAFAKRSEQA